MMEKVASKRALQIRSVISVLTLVVFWEAAARTGLTSPLFLPAFTTVVAEWWTVCADGSLPADLLTSLFRAFAGLFAATVVMRPAGHRDGAQPAGSLDVRSGDRTGVSVTENCVPADLHSLVSASYSVSKILLVAFACVFPIVIGTYAAASSVNRVWIWSAYSLGTSNLALLIRVVLPAAWPRIFAALLRRAASIR